MIICVNMSGNTIIMMEIDAKDTIAKLKEKIQGRVGAVPRFQRLIFAGRELDDWKTLQDYGIVKYDVIRLASLVSLKIRVPVRA